MRPSSNRIVKSQPESAIQRRRSKQWHHHGQGTSLFSPLCPSRKMPELTLQAEPLRKGGLCTGSGEVIKLSWLTWVGNKHAFSRLHEEPLYPCLTDLGLFFAVELSGPWVVSLPII